MVGLSGGVDSAAVAKLLLEEGYRVHGTYLQFCVDSDPEPARLVAEKLGIPFSVVNHVKAFEHQVMAPFVETYRRGRTPNPCVECNRKMKIASLLREADRLGIEAVATGHYARIEPGENDRYQLKMALDPKKDQSYFLWKLTQKQLSRLLFPLAGLEKQDVRVLASHLVPECTKESMEICFVPENDPQKFLAEKGGAMPEGDFVTSSGVVLGKHKGISFYTVGQRRGLGIALGERCFVTRISPENNQIQVGSEDELLISSVTVSHLHFVSCRKGDLPKEGIGIKGRNRSPILPCRLEFCKEGVVAYLEKPVRAFAPGQSACFYWGDTLLFGGEIE